MTGELYIVATPIGNLKDITLRALETLKSADLVLAEDTRVTKKLLSHFEIQKPVWRYDEYVSTDLYVKVKELIAKGSRVALVTDAGTPAIADPGTKLVKFVKSELPNIKITPIPGPAALTAALSVAGFNADQFTFLGYPPHKKGRQKFFKELEEIKTKPVVLYESPHRLVKTLNNLKEVLGEDQEIAVSRELTKVHEENIRLTIKNALIHFQGEHLKGEFVIIVR